MDGPFAMRARLSTPAFPTVAVTVPAAPYQRMPS